MSLPQPLIPPQACVCGLCRTSSASADGTLFNQAEDTPKKLSAVMMEAHKLWQSAAGKDAAASELKEDSEEFKKMKDMVWAAAWPGQQLRAVVHPWRCAPCALMACALMACSDGLYRY